MAGIRPSAGPMATEPSILESILLVDDNPINLQVLCQILEGIGCDLLAATDGESALAIAREQQPVLILLDIVMPGMDGFEACRRLKADPVTREIPVVFLSAMDGTSDKVRGLQLGALDFLSKQFEPEEVIVRVTTHLTLTRLARLVQHQKEQLEEELRVVSQLQRNLLPPRLPELPGLKLAAHYQTSWFAGGDYYDVAALADGRYGFIIADAEGHSSPATVLMAMTCALFRSCPDALRGPGEMLEHLNDNLLKVNRDSFITAAYAVYDPADRSVRIARAGHPHPILFRAETRRAEVCYCHGMAVLGALPTEHFPPTAITLEPGDRLLLYTDGVTESFNPAREQFGPARLARALEATGSRRPEEVVAAIAAEVVCFAEGVPADDDQAMLLLEVSD